MYMYMCVRYFQLDHIYIYIYMQTLFWQCIRIYIYVHIYISLSFFPCWLLYYHPLSLHPHEGNQKAHACVCEVSVRFSSSWFLVYLNELRVCSVCVSVSMCAMCVSVSMECECEYESVCSV